MNREGINVLIGAKRALIKEYCGVGTVPFDQIAVIDRCQPSEALIDIRRGGEDYVSVLEEVNRVDVFGRRVG